MKIRKRETSSGKTEKKKKGTKKQWQNKKTEGDDTKVKPTEATINKSENTVEGPETKVGRPEIKVIPSHETAGIGDEVVFLCQSEGNITWMFNGNKLPNNVKISETYHGLHKITISNVKFSNSGTYSCTNIDSGNSLSQGYGVLSVKGI